MKLVLFKYDLVFLSKFSFLRYIGNSENLQSSLIHKIVINLIIA